MNEKKEQIPITDNMPEDLKAAINYLNKNNISLNDTFDEDEDEVVEAKMSNSAFDFGNIASSASDDDDDEDIEDDDDEDDDLEDDDEDIDESSISF